MLSESNVKTLYDLYENYTDVVEKCKIVTIEEIEAEGFELSVVKYIEKKQKKALSPEEVYRRYCDDLNALHEAEAKMEELLEKGGYVND